MNYYLSRFRSQGDLVTSRWSRRRHMYRRGLRVLEPRTKRHIHFN